MMSLAQVPGRHRCKIRVRVDPIPPLLALGSDPASVNVSTRGGLHQVSSVPLASNRSQIVLSVAVPIMLLAGPLVAVSTSALEDACSSLRCPGHPRSV